MTGSAVRKLRASFASHTVLIVLSAIFVIPFLWLLGTSLKSLNEISLSNLTIIPRVFHWDNYARVFERIPYLRYTMNTLFVTVMSVIGQIISSSLVAYSLTKVEWKGRGIIFPIVVATMLLPFQVTMIPVYMIYQKLGLVGTYWPLIIPTFTGAPFYIFLLRQFFMTLPDTLIQAARIDGANEWKIFSRIVMPLCRPALAAVGIFTFLYTWSDFLGPLLYLNDNAKYTLTLGLQAFMAEHYTEWDLLMAASAMFTLPIIVMFFFAQKYFIEGITLTGIKG
ncbi:carbohydrate ABC transporter membrane protein 2 (CUT1 family) [Paenibacillus taihuensis]|uniref:Carbohydrate ABC transporter membrane protein 2 (CUT1 family) n=1 Tax=Paenibacillus taihuensis TaxID=1156355 RepID=A0A3D9PYV7_9BACL|nr:carbohydrate ABC transporter permease [Paenibacillus taihuensis]REE55452.1 carbohydrate ABC transporter membrane protein 2 (CUT1 family) [Paenibacillus taihuensis]